MRDCVRRSFESVARCLDKIRASPWQVKGAPRDAIALCEFSHGVVAPCNKLPS